MKSNPHIQFDNTSFLSSTTAQHPNLNFIPALPTHTRTTTSNHPFSLSIYPNPSNPINPGQINYNQWTTEPQRTTYASIRRAEI